MIKNPKELTIRAVKAFGMNGQPVAVGEVLTVDYAFARELIGNQKAEAYTAPAIPDTPAPAPAAEAPKPKGRTARSKS